MNLSLWGYVGVFAAVSVVCFGSLRHRRRIEDPDTRRGLTALLALSGAWAAVHVGYLVAPSPTLQYAFFTAGLVAGLAAVGPWLYFCSAYTGRTHHRNTTIRRVSVATFLVVVAVKLTNPLHNWYFTAEVVSEPFSHLAIHHEPLHWVVMAFAYALSFVGVFVLFELFAQVDFDTKPLFGIVALTGLPVVFDIVTPLRTTLPDVTYSALGVAAFALGVFYLHFDQFQTVQLAGEVDDPIVVLDDEGRVHDFNQSARDLFPALSGSVGEAFETLLPDVAAAVASPDAVVSVGRNGRTEYYSVSENPFSADRSRIGRSITLTDVTEKRRHERELERTNERLERFASTVSHDLRNPLNVAQGRLALHREAHDDEHLATASNALDRMERLIEEILTLSRQGRAISETETVALSAVVDDCWEVVDTGEAAVHVESDRSLAADADRLQQLLENLFRNAIEHAGPDVTIRVGSLEEGIGFYVADDGPGIPADDCEAVFESGYSTARDGTGFGLAIVKEIADAHGWDIRATAGTDGGARFEVSGVEPAD